MQLLAAELILSVAQQILERRFDVTNVGRLMFVLATLGRLLEEGVRAEDVAQYLFLGRAVLEEVL